MALGLRTAPRDPTESTGSVTNTGDPLRRRCCEKPWKSSYWRSPLSGETEPPAAEDMDELSRAESASRRVRG
ncbi:hypothetical protein ACFX2B_037953 [Malus domestica]